MGAKNAPLGHPYGITIILQWSEDECLGPVDPIKEYTAETKDRKQWSDMLFISWKMSLAVGISNATIVSLLEETLFLANIEA